MPSKVVMNLAQAIAARDARQLSAFLADDVVATCAGLEDIQGRRALARFWSRIFQRWSVVELHLLRAMNDEALVVVESLYLAARPTENPILLQAHGVFEIKEGLIERWADHLDLGVLPASEVERLRRYRRARW